MKNLKKLSKRGLSVLLALVMCASMLQVPALAAEEPVEPNITIVVEKDPADPVDGVEQGDAENNEDAGQDKGGETGDQDEDDERASQDQDDEDDVWKDITDTKRPAASEDVTHDKGTDKDKVNTPADEEKSWNIFYDADRDVYKITFNIGSEAEKTQTIDLTQALELLGEYAESGKQELQDAINALDKPEMGEPEMEEPVEPGKPEGLDEATQSVWDTVFDLFSSADGNKYNMPGNVLMELEAAGVDPDSEYAKDYADYLVEKADNAYLVKLIENHGQGNMGLYKNFVCMNSDYSFNGMPTAEQEAAAIASVLRSDAKLTAPEYKVDKNSDAYKAYEAAKIKYDAELAEIEKQYGKDKAAYDKVVAKLKADFDRRVGANILEPGDVKKFELFITSDSKHTYKYQSGSFTLATPGWVVNPDGTITGFDGQILPDEYVDRNTYRVSVTAKPIQDLLKLVGVDDPTHPNNKWNLNGNGEVANSHDGNGNITGYMGYWDAEIKKALAEYPGETLADQLNSYILAYYGNEYDSIDALVAGNPKAAAELTKTITSGNKWFSIDGEEFPVQAHTATVKYDHFYKNLFSFAFGTEADMAKILGEAKFKEGTNRWEYENNSWTDNNYQLALYYYMDHKEIWQQTDAYFSALLDGGLTTEQATWTSLMMVLNIDGELTGNDWQDTKWPWYSSIQLEQMDIDFTLTKKDGATGEAITGSETEFQVYYIDKVKNEDGSETSVNMYCTAVTDEEGNVSYTFVTTPSTVWTKNGELNINYAMMKDIVYYLQERTAPEGYEQDLNVYIVMSEEAYGKLSEDDKAALEGSFDKFLDLTASGDGLSVSTGFVNVKIVTPDPEPGNPPPPPENPPEDPDDPPPPPDEPEIPDEEVPLAEPPDDEIEIEDPDVPLTGDNSGTWYATAMLSAFGLAVLVITKKREDYKN